MFLFLFAPIQVQSSNIYIFFLNAADIKGGSISDFFLLFTAIIKGAAAFKCFYFYWPLIINKDCSIYDVFILIAATVTSLAAFIKFKSIKNKIS